MTISPYKYIEITDKEKADAEGKADALGVARGMSIFFPWIAIGTAIYEATTDDKGNKFVKKKVFCDRTAADETSVSECIDTILALRSVGNQEQGGYKAFGKYVAIPIPV